MEQKELTLSDIANRVAIRVGLFILIVIISFPLSTLSYLCLLLPFITGIAALIFVVKTLFDAQRWHLERKLSFRNAYIIGAFIIALIETGLIFWYMSELGSINWI